MNSTFFIKVCWLWVCTAAVTSTLALGQTTDTPSTEDSNAYAALRDVRTMILPQGQDMPACPYSHRLATGGSIILPVIIWRMADRTQWLCDGETWTLFTGRHATADTVCTNATEGMTHYAESRRLQVCRSERWIELAENTTDGGEDSGMDDQGDAIQTEPASPAEYTWRAGIWTEKEFGAIQVVTRFENACALLAGGTVKCWGYNFFGDLGSGHSGQGADSATTVNVIGISSAIHLVTGGYHTCALLADGRVKCWGHNVYGQLGNGPSGPGVLASTPVVVRGLSGVIQLVLGDYHSCALLEDGRVKCWGKNHYGQLGNGRSGQDVHSITPVAVHGISRAAKLIAGDKHTCALLESGIVKCWGYNGHRQLGNPTSGSRPHSAIPLVVPGIYGAIQLVSGDYHTCALLENGRAKCWGHNVDGQLGNGHYREGIGFNAPMAVRGLVGASLLVTSVSTTCALFPWGKAKCWGYARYGQLGNGRSGLNTDSAVPVAVREISDAHQLALSRYHSCALLEGGTVKCWGMNRNGELGNGLSGAGVHSNTAVTVSGLSGVIQLAVERYYSCALLGDGTVKCWGSNYTGQLGDGRSGRGTGSAVPVTVLNLTTRMDVRAVDCVDRGGRIVSDDRCTAPKPATHRSI
ncbi:MAG: hypothetical protein AAF442_08585 [Pseudomonadota bacterium]